MVLSVRADLSARRAPPHPFGKPETGAVATSVGDKPSIAAT